MALRSKQKKRTEDVFGVSNVVLTDSYVDRGNLDAELRRLLSRRTHIALRGASKSGKSWLRQRLLPEAIVVQCRHRTTTTDLYKDALAQLGVQLDIDSTVDQTFKGTVTASAELGSRLLAKAGLSVGGDWTDQISNRKAAVGHEITNVSLVVDILRASGSRIVIEDLHYLSVRERKSLAYDLKVFWDEGVFVLLVGVWTQGNLLLSLNSDLRGRLTELSVEWTDTDLREILNKGGDALNLSFSSSVSSALVRNSYANAGVLQQLTLGVLDEMRIEATCEYPIVVGDLEAFQGAALLYAGQLEQYYLEWAQRLSNGMRRRRESTGIYAHALAAILDCDDESLLKGIDRKALFDSVRAKESRIQLGNLRTVLNRFEQLQVDEDGRGLVLSYQDKEPGVVSVVDRELLLYRKFATVSWPWPDLISESPDALAGD